MTSIVLWLIVAKALSARPEVRLASNAEPHSPDPWAFDHILGGMLSTFMRWEAIEEVNIYGTRHTMDRVSDLINGVVLRGTKPPMPLNLLEIKPGLIFQSKHFAIQAFPVDHRGSSSLGYRFIEKSHRPFLSEVAEALGVPNGPCRRDLVQGQSITLEDGRVIKPEDVLGDERPGVNLVIVGDVETEKLREHVAGADDGDRGDLPRRSTLKWLKPLVIPLPRKWHVWQQKLGGEVDPDPRFKALPR